MDQTQAPVLGALFAHLVNGRLAFTPPGHKQGRGTDPRVLEVLGSGLFQADVLATGRLDDRTASIADTLPSDVVQYLSTGRAAGMLIPDAADPQLRTLRVSCA